MNSHLLPYPYNQIARPPLIRCRRLGEFFYKTYIRFQPSPVSPLIANGIKVVCISDTHNSTPEVPDGDLLIHAGDLTKDGTYTELQAQLDWLTSLPHPHKVVVGGNHDLVLDPSFAQRFPLRLPHDHYKSPPPLTRLKWGDITYLQDNSVTLDFEVQGRKLKIYGSPRTPELGIWVFQYPAIRDVWTNQIPDDADVVVTHGPPVLYRNSDRKGDGYLLKELRRVKPRLAVFGHVHDGYGEDELVHDGVQNARDEVVLDRSGMYALVRMGFWIVLMWFGFLFRFHRAPVTRLVNAAVTPGKRNMGEKRAIVLEL
ncbi:hypothetical protein AJ79_07999 [Helicocarpus griseus UAMH5409]|uniref:Calcineurin-like phosphoesterase domain-containing protein n=1 Tax=Helicocarpus griseus UAMH5409 TaxID=1447875 RepID=A0A2B7WXC5_9EURO|nr:hypothetical protein AJ79_07999 [Helicocarpus griseus UAMH5409]